MANLQALKAELLAGHPDTGAYNADDQLAADEINALNRDIDVDSATLLEYCITTEFRGSSIYGRIVAVANAKPGDLLPLGNLGADITLTLGHISSANAFIRFMEPDIDVPVKSDETEFDNMLSAMALGANNAQALGSADKTAIIALSQAKQSRANELNIGRVRKGTVAQARQL